MGIWPLQLVLNPTHVSMSVSVLHFTHFIQSLNLKYLSSLFRFTDILPLFWFWNVCLVEWLFISFVLRCLCTLPSVILTFASISFTWCREDLVIQTLNLMIGIFWFFIISCVLFHFAELAITVLMHNKFLIIILFF